MMPDFYNNLFGKEREYLAFVMKNQMPYSCKVLLLHEKLGKIWCIFDTKHQAALLHTGSLIYCILEPVRHQYRFLHIEIESMISSEHVLLIHNIMRICTDSLQEHVATPELFDFLKYVFSALNDLDDKGSVIVLLRLFLMCDYLIDDATAYQIAVSDPVKSSCYDMQELNLLLEQCWDRFYEKNS
jgi:hypothetical protein